jgi:hypothetical protein
MNHAGSTAYANITCLQVLYSLHLRESQYSHNVVRFKESAARYYFIFEQFVDLGLAGGGE